MTGDDEDFFEEEARSEAAMDAAGEAYEEEIAQRWVKDNAAELDKKSYQRNYEQAYDQAIEEFTAERLQSFYLNEPRLAIPALDSLLYSKSLQTAFPQAALVFAVTATELTIKTVLLRPIINGLVHVEDLASVISELTTKHIGMDRFHNLLTGILEKFGGFRLGSYKRDGSTKTLWEEIKKVQDARNEVVHKGAKSDAATAALAIAVADTLLNRVFPSVLKNLGLHFHAPMKVCNCKTP